MRLFLYPALSWMGARLGNCRERRDSKSGRGWLWHRLDSIAGWLYKRGDHA